MRAINLLYLHANFLGYGRMGSQLAAALKRADVIVYDHLAGSEDYYDSDAGQVPPVLHRIGSDTGKRRAGRAEVACWVSSPSHHGMGWFEGQRSVCYTMWEGTRAPEGLRQFFHEFDQLIVPSRQNHELFAKYHHDVQVVPLGVDPQRWHYRARTHPTRAFNFLCAGAGRRKGSDLAVKAFKKLWGKEGSWPADGPVPHLILKTPRRAEHYGDRITNITEYLTDDEETDLYAMAHCYLQASRGEGFGLMPLQAIAQGCPTILTDAHGHESFAHLGLGIKATLRPSDTFLLGDAGDWWEPDFGELCERMEFVYHHYSACTKIARANAAAARARFSWDECAHGFLEAIDYRLGPYTGNGRWHALEQKLYRVITKDDHYCEIGGVALQFVAGREYFQAADVKRVLFEAGLLDPACIDEPDAGLTEREVEHFHKHRAQYETCPTCLRRLNGVVE